MEMPNLIKIIGEAYFLDSEKRSEATNKAINDGKRRYLISLIASLPQSPLFKSTEEIEKYAKEYVLEKKHQSVIRGFLGENNIYFASNFPDIPFVAFGIGIFATQNQNNLSALLKIDKMKIEDIVFSYDCNEPGADTEKISFKCPPNYFGNLNDLEAIKEAYKSYKFDPNLIIEKEKLNDKMPYLQFQLRKSEDGYEEYFNTEYIEKAIKENDPEEIERKNLNEAISLVKKHQTDNFKIIGDNPIKGISSESIEKTIKEIMELPVKSIRIASPEHDSWRGAIFYRKKEATVLSFYCKEGFEMFSKLVSKL